MYKFLAIDLDGTLLNSYGEISEENKKAVLEAKNQGIEVVIASGRIADSAKKFANEVNANKYLIAGNGTVIMDVENNNIIYENFIPKEKALEIIKICEENSMFYNVYTQKGIIAPRLNHNVQVYYYENSQKEEEKRTNINIVEEVYDYIKETNTSPISKIDICDDNKIIFDRITNRLRKIDGVSIIETEHKSKRIIRAGTEYVGLQYYYTEITNKEANKWQAIKKIADILQIKDEEIAVIGDNINDEEMIKRAGLGIAMGESSETLKNKSDKVTLDNDNDGVAYAIHNYIL